MNSKYLPADAEALMNVTTAVAVAAAAPIATTAAIPAAATPAAVSAAVAGVGFGGLLFL